MQLALDEPPAAMALDEPPAMQSDKERVHPLESPRPPWPPSTFMSVWTSVWTRDLRRGKVDSLVPETSRTLFSALFAVLPVRRDVHL